MGVCVSARKPLLWMLAVLAALASSRAPVAQQTRTDGVPAIPGITVDDPFPRACVDCHVNRPDLGTDFRLGTLMRQWEESVDPDVVERLRRFVPEGMALKGRHPPVANWMRRIPAGCAGCHTADSTTAPPLGPLMHGIHLTGGANNHYITHYGGKCMYCHKLDQATGKWSVPSAPEP
ncbi:MAG: hypothetical protein PVH31_04985 [Ectothiorhodospiraceae bacterium]|jgi:hypothetical protein